MTMDVQPDHASAGDEVRVELSAEGDYNVYTTLTWDAAGFRFLEVSSGGSDVRIDERGVTVNESGVVY